MSVERWAARHDALVTRAVSAAEGLTPDQLRHRIDTGRYVRLRENVYAIIHVVGAAFDQVRLEGVVSHRSTLLVDDDVIRRDGLRLTAPVRTVVDVSGMFTIPLLGRAVDQLMRQRRLDLAELRARVSLLRPAPGAR